jgi:hypothetical protein
VIARKKSELTCRNHSLAPNADRDVIKQRLGNLLSLVLDVRKGQIGAQQSNAAVDIESDASRRHHRQRVIHVEGSDVADGEAVSAGNSEKAAATLTSDMGEKEKQRTPNVCQASQGLRLQCRED